MADECFNYNCALVSRVPNSFESISNYDLLNRNLNINIERARREQEELINALQRIGVDVIELPSDESQPDAMFVNDMAVVINGTALICSPPTIPNKPARVGEQAVVRQVLRKELGVRTVEMESDKMHLEGGDVLFTGREIFVGLSTRTNLLGAQMVAKTFPDYPTMVVKVHPPAIHLKDYINMAGPEIMAVGKSKGAQATFQGIKNSGTSGYKYISVDEDEAANVIYANNFLIHLSSDLIPNGSVTYSNKINYPRVAIHMAEPLKRGRGLSNCVLLLNVSRVLKKVPFTKPILNDSY